MTRHHDKRSSRVGEPVQVYLDRDDRKRLDRLAEQLVASKSSVLRRALESLERELLDPEAHPVLGIIGLARGGGRPGASELPYDVAREHDRFLASSEPGLSRVSPGRGKGSKSGKRRRAR